MVSKTYTYQTDEPEAFLNEQRRLLLQWAPSFFIAALQHPEQGEIEATEVFQGRLADPAHLEQAANQSHLLTMRHLPVTVLNADRNFMPVPLEHFDPNNATDAFGPHFIADQELRQFSDRIEPQSMVVQWGMPVSVAETLSDYFEVVHYRHLMSSIVALPSENADWARLVFCGDYCLFSLWKEGRLQIASTLPIHTPDDLAYRCLLALKNLQLHNEQFTWYYSGMIDQDSNLFKTLNQFLFDLQPWQPVDLGEGTREGHYFSQLQKIVL